MEKNEKVNIWTKIAIKVEKGMVFVKTCCALSRPPESLVFDGAEVFTPLLSYCLVPGMVSQFSLFYVCQLGMLTHFSCRSFFKLIHVEVCINIEKYQCTRFSY